MLTARASEGAAGRRIWVLAFTRHCMRCQASNMRVPRLLKYPRIERKVFQQSGVGGMLILVLRMRRSVNFG